MTSEVRGGVGQLVKDAAEPIDGIDNADLSKFVERVKDAKVVLFGSASEGTSEFFRWRTRLTRELLMHHGFTLVAADADWADCSRVDRHVRMLPKDPRPFRCFDRFPQWTWRNYETMDFVEWQRAHNVETRTPAHRAGFFGLDVYGFQASAEEALRTLEGISPELAERARARLSQVTPWPSLTQGPLELGDAARDVEAVVVRRLTECLLTRLELSRHEGDRYQECLDRTRIAAEADRTWRALSASPLEAWSQRQKHLFETLETLLAAGGSKSKAIVWGHDATVGDSAATKLHERGVFSLGHLCRRQWRDKAYLVGFGTDHGSLLGAKAWEQAPDKVRLKAAPDGSVEQLMKSSGVPAFALPLRGLQSPPLRDVLLTPRPRRNWGAVASESQEELVEASLLGQFDEFVWFEETRAANPLGPQPPVEAIPDTWPFGS